MADQQEHLTAATGVDVGDVPARPRRLPRLYFGQGGWAARVRVRPTSLDTYVAAGAYEVSQRLYGNDWRNGWELNCAQDSGVHVPVEVGY